MRDVAKARVKDMVSLVGRTRTERLLIAHEVSPSTAYKLVRDSYQSTVGEMVSERIEKAWTMARQMRSAS